MRTFNYCYRKPFASHSKKLGIKIPAIALEHQYIVTEKDPELQRYREKNGEHPVIRDADAKWYVREERADGY